MTSVAPSSLLTLAIANESVGRAVRPCGPSIPAAPAHRPSGVMTAAIASGDPVSTRSSSTAWNARAWASGNGLVGSVGSKPIAGGVPDGSEVGVVVEIGFVVAMTDADGPGLEPGLAPADPAIEDAGVDPPHAVAVNSRIQTREPARIQPAACEGMGRSLSSLGAVRSR